MLLIVDVGNTQTVLGLWNNEKIIGRWRIGTTNISTEDELLVHVNHFLDFSGFNFKNIDGICVASVVPQLNSTFRHFSEKYLRKSPLFVKTENVKWLEWRVKTPTEIGADRVANVIAARELFRRDVVVVDFGTAITLDILTNVYEGGSILPGPRTAMKALFSSTAKLPFVDEKIPPSSVGKDTPTNIQSGVMLGTIIAIDGLISHYEAELSKKFKVVSTGGHGELLSKMSNQIIKHIPDLTLFGIATYHQKILKK